MDSKIQLIVGLGNPDREYEHTRHNAGADLVTELARQTGASLKPENKFFGLTAKTTIEYQSVRLLLPTTYMNLSGKSVAAIANFFKVEPQNILIVYDELDLEPGVARFKLGGGPGGHNGLRDIIKHLGNDKSFARLRLGIGHPGNAKAVSGYVLKKAPQAEQSLIDEAMLQALRCLPLAVSGKWNQAMKELHTS